MTKVSVMAGPCKFVTVITAENTEDYGQVKVSFTSDCPHYNKGLAEEIDTVDAFCELGMGRNPGIIKDAVAKYAKHATCPVALAMLKAVEVEASLALPVEPEIHIEKN